MWFFMITCYVMSFLTLCMLLLAMLQNYFHFYIFRAEELTFVVLTSIVYLFTETLIIFFFVGTGVSIKEYTAQKNLNHDFHKKSISIKRRIYPPQLLNMLFLMTLFCLYGAVDTGKVSVWIYRSFFLFCLWHFIYAKKIQHDCFVDNTNNILAMAGIQRSS